MTSEVNFDGIVGPTHNYSGLSYGNVASLTNQQAVSNPKEAALQGLHKMKFLMDLGLQQAVLPPQERPHLPTLRALGFDGSDQDVILTAFKQAPELFFSCCSASSMWAANAATISPSADSQDHRVHITPANLTNKFHRSIEAETTSRILETIFSNPGHFVHHAPLLSSHALADEGAANHTRFCKDPTQVGVQLFVFGRYGLGKTAQEAGRYPARYTFEAAQTIARLHQLNPENALFAQQNPRAIDAGVFHNDVISVGHEELFFYHESAFLNSEQVIEQMRNKMIACCKTPMTFIKVPEHAVSLEDAVKSYLFNSQIVTVNGAKQMIAPIECQEVPSVTQFLQEMQRDPHCPISKIHYLNLRESMRNGGGPACLRLRVVLNEKERKAAHSSVFLTDKLYLELVNWVNRYYRDTLRPADLADPKLLEEGREALDALTGILRLGSIYDFQKRR